MNIETTAELFRRYQDGDSRAADELFVRYVDRLTRLARARLSPRLATRTSPEDVVMSAYRSFFIAARDGRFSLERSGDLWRLLVSITLHKVYRHARRHRAASRSVDCETPLFDDVLLAAEPAPEEVVGIADEIQALFAKLNEFERRVIELRLQDETLDSIAEQTGRSERTIRRTLDRVRQLLQKQLDSEE